MRILLHTTPRYSAGGPRPLLMPCFLSARVTRVFQTQRRPPARPTQDGVTVSPSFARHHSPLFTLSPYPKKTTLATSRPPLARGGLAHVTRRVPRRALPLLHPRDAPAVMAAGARASSYGHVFSCPAASPQAAPRYVWTWRPLLPPPARLLIPRAAQAGGHAAFSGAGEQPRTPGQRRR